MSLGECYCGVRFDQSMYPLLNVMLLNLVLYTYHDSPLVINFRTVALFRVETETLSGRLNTLALFFVQNHTHRFSQGLGELVDSNIVSL